MKNYKSIKKGVINKTASVLSAPARAGHGIKSKYYNMKADNRIASRNFKNRADNTNYYKGTSYWKKNKN